MLAQRATSSFLSFFTLRLTIIAVVGCLGLSALALTLGAQILPSRILVYATAQYRGYNVHTMDVERGMTFFTARNMIADWFSMDCSPDGKQIIFPAKASVNWTSSDLYLMDAIDGNITTLVRNADSDVSPRWSPDGQSIAFVTFHRSGAGGISVVNRDGSSPVQVAEEAVVDQLPDWSPDGKRIVFMTKGVKRPEIAVAILGAGWKPLTDNDLYDGMPTWSPDGQSIAFVSFRENNYDIYLMDGDGGSVQRLTTTPAFDTNPVWSPDGSRIAFVSSRGGTREVYVMEADGTNQRPLAEALTVTSAPVWSRDGTLLTVLSKGDGDKEIYLVKANGGGYRRLTDNEQDDFLPAWCG